MKRTIQRAVGLFAAMVFLSLAVPAVAQETTDRFAMLYNYESGALTIEGTSSLRYRENVYVAIAPLDQELSEDDLYFQIPVESNGSFTETVKITSVLQTGEYNVYINNSSLRTLRVLILPDIETLQEVTAAVNAETESGIRSLFSNVETVQQLALDSEFVAQNLDALAAYLYACRPAAGYDSNGLIEAYAAARCIIAMDNGDDDAEMLLQRYADYLGIDYEANYNSLSQTARETLLALAQRGRIASARPFVQYYRELSFMAQVKSCGSYDKLMTYIVENYAAAELDLTAYNRISSQYRQQEIFRELYRAINGIDTFAELRSKFSQLVQESEGGNTNTGTRPGGSGSGSGGTSAGSPAGIGSIQIDNSGIAPGSETEAAAVFADMQDHWAAAEIGELYRMGVVNGYDDGLFRPDGTVTRSEFVQMLCKSLDAAYGGANMFEDVNVGDWYFESVNTAAELGLVNGFDNRFEPESFITRQDAAVILHRAFTYKGVILTGQASFADDDRIVDYARESVSVLAANGIILGNGDGFAPEDNLTRAEAGVLIYRFIQKIQ